MGKFSVTVDGESFEIEVKPLFGSDHRFSVTVDGEAVPVVMGDLEAGDAWATVGGRPYEYIVDRDLRWIKGRTGRHSLEIQDQGASGPRPVSGDGRIKAPVPGLINRVLVQAGDHVEAGQPIVVLEAMKMENEVRALRAGGVQQIIDAGQVVRLHQVLADIA